MKTTNKMMEFCALFWVISLIGFLCSLFGFISDKPCPLGTLNYILMNICFILYLLVAIGWEIGNISEYNRNYKND